MNNLLFTVLLIALIYYFFYYLPQQKKLTTANLPLQHHQSTQTEALVTNPDSQALNHLQQQLIEKEKMHHIWNTS